MTTLPLIETRPGAWSFSWHAEQRRAQMGLSLDEVTSALDGAELNYPDATDATGKRRIAVAGRLAVVHNPIARVIVTILWAGLETRAA